jgi:hypothetical protein
VKPRFNLHTFAIVLCVLALFTAQLFGVQLGYLCACAGKVVLTQTTHCHGPHGIQCHASNNDCSDSHCEEGQEDREEHTVLKGDLPLRSAEAGPQFADPPMLFALPLIEILLAPPVAEVPVPFVDQSPPPFGVTIARTVVLLI